jgi:hypothetical protein
VEAWSNTSTVELRVLGGRPVPGGYICGDMALQLGGSLESETVNVVMSPAGLGPENDCAGEDQKKL